MCDKANTKTLVKAVPQNGLVKNKQQIDGGTSNCWGRQKLAICGRMGGGGEYVASLIMCLQ